MKIEFCNWMMIYEVYYEKVSIKNTIGQLYPITAY